MSRPQLHTSVYPAIAPETLGRANKGKVAVVTGAARGIGQAIAEALAKSGADVALLDLDEERQAETKSKCEKLGVRARAYGCNVLNVESCERTFVKIREDLGPVDILVNNVGGNTRRPFAMETFEQFWSGVEMNLKSAMLCIFQVLPGMRQRGHGCIINIASRAGTVPMPFGGAYCTGKGALIRAVSCIQKELEMDGFGDSIHVYALHPGATLSQPSLSFHADVAEAYPQEAEKWSKFHKLFKCPPAQCAQTCAFLATGQGKVLRGRYFDCEQDIGMVIAAGEEGLRGLYELKVDFLGGLPNDGGTAVAVIEHQTNGVDKSLRVDGVKQIL